MFGFGQKAKLKKMGEELKGASLAEVVEKFADSKLIERCQSQCKLGPTSRSKIGPLGPVWTAPWHTCSPNG